MAFSSSENGGPSDLGYYCQLSIAWTAPQPNQKCCTSAAEKNIEETKEFERLVVAVGFYLLFRPIFIRMFMVKKPPLAPRITSLKKHVMQNNEKKIEPQRWEENPRTMPWV